MKKVRQDSLNQLVSFKTNLKQLLGWKTDNALQLHNCNVQACITDPNCIRFSRCMMASLAALFCTMSGTIQARNRKQENDFSNEVLKIDLLDILSKN